MASKKSNQKAKIKKIKKLTQRLDHMVPDVRTK